MPARRNLALTSTALLAAVVLQPVGPTSAGSAPPSGAPAEPAGVVLDWERIAIATVYPTVAPTPIPLGVPLLGYTSVAMYDAARRADRQPHTSAAAAVVVAAHDVLTYYFPAADLDDERDASLDALPDGVAKARGEQAGATAAEAMIRRTEDPRLNPDGIVYERDEAPGVWQPAPGGTMLGAWLGFMDPLVVRRPVRVDGPDPLDSADYAFDYQEVKRVGALNGADRTAAQTDTALFFNSNSAIMVGEGTLAYLEQHPRDLRTTARLFAVMHGAMTDSIITCWRLKYEVGFWRPSQAIAGAGTDGNPATVPDASWAPLVPNPPYSDYVSGHACLTAPAVETVRDLLGEETALTLHSYNTNADRTYPTLSEIEFDAFHARIWSGLHFRKAMEDGYRIGHEMARRALRALR